MNNLGFYQLWSKFVIASNFLVAVIGRGFCLFGLLGIVIFAADYSIFHDQAFYQELLKRIDGNAAVTVRRIIDQRLFMDFSTPRTNALLRDLERQGIICDWLEYRSAFAPFIKDNLIDKIEERRYFYLRESFRQMANATVDQMLISYANDVAASDFLAILTDVQFRSLLAPLADTGFLEKFFSCVGDVSFFYAISDLKNDWDLAFKNNSEQMTFAEARVSALITVVRAFPQDIRDRAGRIRDSGYFSLYYQPDVQKVVKSDLFNVFESFFQKNSLGDKVQKLYETGLLLQAVDEGKKKHENYARRLLEPYTEEDNKLSMNSFLQSKGFRIFFDQKWAAEMHYLNKNGILKKLSDLSDDLLVLLSPELSDMFSEVELFYLAEAERLHSRNQKKLQREEETRICRENMLILMRGRESYALKYREEVDLNFPEKKAHYFNFLATEGLRCPSGGEYYSTSHGWIYCNKHGKAPIPDYERSNNSDR